MPIPDFDHNGVLPPHLGMPTKPADLSPYLATVGEVCQRFSFSKERKEILVGWLELRRSLRILGYVEGFQWIDGSFSEDIETTGSRVPGDIDVVSFLLPTKLQLREMDGSLVHVLSNRAATKARFHVDHFIVLLNASGVAIVEQTRYWCGLFSHRRLDSIWKGMLKVEIGNQMDDDTAVRQYLENRETT